MKILVIMEGKIWDDWNEKYCSVDSWFLDGIGKPSAAELGPDGVTIALTLNAKIDIDTTLHLGPIDIDGKRIEDSFLIEAGGSRDGDCDCDELSVETLQLWHHVETEDNAWAYEIIEPPGCSINADSRLITGAPICFDPYALSFWQDEDYCLFGDYFEDPSLTPWLPFSMEDGKNTFFVGKDAASEWTVELSAGCGEGNPRWHETLSASFGSADIYNPVFEEEPRIVFGPEAADWMESKLALPGAHPGAFTQQSIYCMRNDICGAYILVDVYDGHNEPGAMGGIYIDIMDRFGNYDPPVGMAGLGGEIWIDREDPYYQEYENWADPSHDPLPVDAEWKHEELVMAFSFDIIMMGDPLHVRIRAKDYEGNWTRSEDLLEGGGRGDAMGDGGRIGSWDQVVDLFFREPRRYPGYEYSDREYRKECDGYVRDREATLSTVEGETTLDLIAVVRTLFPIWAPTCLEAELRTPSHEPYSTWVTVKLYRVSYSSPDWQSICNDTCALGGVCYDCIEIYARQTPEGDREFVHGPEFPSGGDPSWPLPIRVTDNQESSPDHAAAYNEEPVLYVSSNDELIAQGGEEDYKDYTRIVGSAEDGGVDDDLIEGGERIVACYYGDGLRGIYGPPAESLFGSCGGGGEFQDGYRNNVLTFGQEWIMATCEQKFAYFPVQSKADIAFVLSHGEIDQSGQTYMCWFPESPAVSVNNTVYANDCSAFLSEGDDTQWIASTACKLLADEEIYDNINAWIAWHALVNDSANNLTAVMGFRAIHNSAPVDDIDPSVPGWEGFADAETRFWQLFCQRLDSETYEPASDNVDGELIQGARWVGGVSEALQADYAVLCYMESAWDYYYMDLTAEGWSEIATKAIWCAAAVDEGARYYLDNDHNDDSLPFDCMIVRVDLQP